MKESPQAQKLEEVLRSSKLVSGGFMGDDLRSFSEIIDKDMAALSHLGYKINQVAATMQKITDTAISGFGSWVKLDQRRETKADEAKGSLVCPWPHPGRFAKRVTTVRLIGADQTIKWSDLSIHLIAEHGFFEGKGSAFRIEPEDLIKIIFENELS